MGTSLPWPPVALPGQERDRGPQRHAKQPFTQTRKLSQSKEVTCSRSHSKLFLGRSEGTRLGSLLIW